MGWHSDDKDKIDRKRWARLRREVLDRDGWRCQQPLGNEICGRKGRLECDHRTPMRWGGDVYALENLWILCRQHHFEKSARESKAESEGSQPEGVGDWRAFVAERMSTSL